MRPNRKPPTPRTTPPPGVISMPTEFHIRGVEWLFICTAEGCGHSLMTEEGEWPEGWYFGPAPIYDTFCPLCPPDEQTAAATEEAPF